MSRPQKTRGNMALPARDTMEDRELTSDLCRYSRRLVEEIRRAGGTDRLVAQAQRIVTMSEEVVDRVVDMDETIALVMVDLRTRPSASERRRRITARGTELKRRQRAIAAVG